MTSDLAREREETAAHARWVDNEVGERQLCEDEECDELAAPEDFRYCEHHLAELSEAQRDWWADHKTDLAWEREHE